jgi:L-asparagine transporter-like permease
MEEFISLGIKVITIVAVIIIGGTILIRQVNKEARRGGFAKKKW